VLHQWEAIIAAPSRSLDEGKEHEWGAFHGIRHKGNLGALVVTGLIMGGRMATNHGRPTIFADGMPAPLVTSFTTSKALSRSVDVTKADDMTLAGGAPLNGGIFLAMAVVDKAY
jgi:hypothetical protein